MKSSQLEISRPMVLFTRTHHFGTDRPKLSHAIMRPNKMAEPTGMIGMLRLNFIFKINSIWVCLKIAYPQIHWCIIVFQECNFEGTFTTIFQTNTISLVELCLIAAPGRQPFYSASVPLRGSAHVYGYTIFWDTSIYHMANFLEITAPFFPIDES